jgi:hypothetical protein
VVLIQLSACLHLSHTHSPYFCTIKMYKQQIKRKTSWTGDQTKCDLSHWEACLSITSLWDIGTSSHMSVLCIYASADSIHSARPRETSSWFTSTTCHENKIQIYNLFPLHTLPSSLYHFTTLRRAMYPVVFLCKTHLCIFFVGYFTMLSVTQTIQSQMVIWLMNDELERIWKKELSQDSWWHRWDLNQAVPKQKHNH